MAVLKTEMKSMLRLLWAATVLLAGSPLWAGAESSERFRLLVDDIECAKSEDAAAAPLFQKALLDAVTSLRRFDLITKESLADKIQTKAKGEAGLELTDSEIAKVGQLAGGKFMLRARLSEIRRSIRFIEKIPRRHLEVRLSLRLIDIETVTALGSLPFVLNADEGIEGESGMLQEIVKTFRRQLDFDLKDLLRLRTDQASIQGWTVKIPLGSGMGVTPGMHFQLYTPDTVLMENEYGESVRTPAGRPAGTARIARVFSNESVADLIQVVAGRSAGPVSAVEWNQRGLRIGLQAGLTTFRPNLPSTTLASSNFDKNNTNYRLKIDGTDSPFFASSRLSLGGSDWTPFLNFDVGYAPGKLEFFGRLNLVFASPLVSWTVDPGIKLHLLETGVVDFSLTANGKIGWLGGKIGSVQFTEGRYLLNTMTAANALLPNGGDLPLGSVLTFGQFLLGAGGQAQVAIALRPGTRLSLLGGYDFLPTLFGPWIFLERPDTLGSSGGGSVALDDKIAAKILTQSIDASRLYFGISYSSLF